MRKQPDFNSAKYRQGNTLWNKNKGRLLGLCISLSSIQGISLASLGSGAELIETGAELRDVGLDYS